jgi:hypothetical protein
MATKSKLIVMLCVALQLLLSCKPTRYTRQKTGKSIPVKLQYKTPFKLGDTLFISFKCSITDLQNSTNSPVGDFKTYTAYGGPFVTKKDTVVVPDAGKYIKNGKDIPQFPPIEYNFATGNFEYNYGYIPFMKGIYQIQGGGINLSPNSNKFPSWRLPIYIEGEASEPTTYPEFKVE